MELDVFEVLLGHAQHVAAIGQEHVSAVLILGHILVLALLKVFQLLWIVALNPAGLIQMYGLPAALGVVLVLQTILDNFELQLSYGSDNLAVVKLVNEQLCHTLVHQLVDTLLQLLGLHGVVVLDILEQLRRERRQSAEVQLFAFGQCVANLKHTACIGQTYDIAWPSLVDGALTLRHKLCGA